MTTLGRSRGAADKKRIPQVVLGRAGPGVEPQTNLGAMPEVNGRDVVGSSTRSYHLEGTRLVGRASVASRCLGRDCADRPP